MTVSTFTTATLATNGHTPRTSTALVLAERIRDTSAELAELLRAAELPRGSGAEGNRTGPWSDRGRAKDRWPFGTSIA